MIARILAIFQVKEIIISPIGSYKNQSREGDLISTVLHYMETPQYLRRYLFSITSNLRYAGFLPPLRTSHHPLTKKSMI